MLNCIIDCTVVRVMRALRTLMHSTVYIIYQLAEACVTKIEITSICRYNELLDLDVDFFLFDFINATCHVDPESIF